MNARTFTPDVVTVGEDGRKTTTMHLKRCCNGCGIELGDVDSRDVDRRGNLTDVRGECANCKPLVEAEAAGCRTWQLYPRDFNRIADEIDRLRPEVSTKPFWRPADGKLCLRIGQYPNHVVASFGDWIIRHPDGRFTIHAAPKTGDHA
jgi:hypothetical protein